MTATGESSRMIRRYALRAGLVACCILPIALSDAMADEPPAGNLPAANEQRIFTGTGARGMVIAVIDGDSTLIHGYGETRPGSKMLPDASSLVRIGSLSKLLAADLLVKLAGDGKLRLTDPLQQYAPNGYRIPLSASRPITLFDLATHTSGLPRQADLPQHSTIPYAIARWQWLQRQHDLPAPGHSALYSNLAFDFLADALATAAGMSYEQALQRDITGPLGMRDTTDAPSAEQCRRLMDGGQPNPIDPCSNGSANAGSGGMYSTTADMVAWMKQQLGLSHGETGPDEAISQASYFSRQALASVQGMDNGGYASGLGMGWVWLAANDQRPAIIEKTGGGGGFMTYMALVPGRRIGIFVAVSKVDIAMLQALAQRVNALATQLDHAHGNAP